MDGNFVRGWQRFISYGIVRGARILNVEPALRPEASRATPLLRPRLVDNMVQGTVHTYRGIRMELERQRVKSHLDTDCTSPGVLRRAYLRVIEIIRPHL